MGLLFFTYLYHYLCYHCNFVLKQRSSQHHPIHLNIDIPTIHRRWHDIVHVMSIHLDIPLKYNVFHSNQLHRGMYHFYIVHAHCIVNRIILYCIAHHPIHHRIHMLYQYIFHAVHNPLYTVLYVYLRQHRWKKIGK